MLRWLLVKVGQTATRWEPELPRKYQRLKFRRGRNVAKVALARHLAVQLYWALGLPAPGGMIEEQIMVG
jgi:transposase